MNFSISLVAGKSVCISGGSNSAIYEDVLLRDEGKQTLLERLTLKGQCFTAADKFALDWNQRTNLTWAEALQEISRAL